MCPACMASAAMMIGSVVSTGGLGVLMVKVFGRKNQTKKSFQKQNPKEETWAK